MVLWRVNGSWKKNNVIVYIMFSKNNTIDFEPAACAAASPDLPWRPFGGPRASRGGLGCLDFLIQSKHSLVNILQARVFFN